MLVVWLLVSVVVSVEKTALVVDDVESGCMVVVAVIGPNGVVVTVVVVVVIVVGS